MGGSVDDSLFPAQQTGDGLWVGEVIELLDEGDGAAAFLYGMIVPLIALDGGCMRAARGSRTESTTTPSSSVRIKTASLATPTSAASTAWVRPSASTWRAAIPVDSDPAADLWSDGELRMLLRLLSGKPTPGLEILVPVLVFRLDHGKGLQARHPQ